jgi:multiple sugar transport system substrate-binding protein
MFSPTRSTRRSVKRTLLKKVDFGPELTGFAEQLEYARSWGAYASGPIPIGTLWNLAGRGFGMALSSQRSADDAAKELLQEVRKLMPQKS